jgi:hypothetical protein
LAVTAATTTLPLPLLRKRSLKPVTWSNYSRPGKQFN